MAGLFSVIAGVLMVATVSIYLVRLVRGKTIPNPVTWIIAAVALTLNNLTYLVIVKGHLIENIPGLLVNVATLFVVVLSFKKGRAQLVRSDVFVFIVAVAIGAVWRLSGDAFIANVALQGVLLLSFWPTFIGLLEGRLRDHPFPWLVAVASYVFQILTIVANRDDWTWHAFVFPVVNGIIGNGAVAFAAWRRNVQLQTQSAPSSS